MNNEVQSQKKQVLDQWKDSIISAINSCLDDVKAQIEIENGFDTPNKDTLKNLELSLDRYNNLKAKIIFEEELNNADYSLIAIICATAAHKAASSVKKILDGIEQLKNLSKIFIV